MATTEFIAAIELSSSKISGVAGKRNSDGSIQVLAYAHEEAGTFMRKGAIYNVDKTAQALNSIIGKLEAQLNNSIAKVYVGIGGQSLRTVKNTVSRTLDEEGVITQPLIDNICDENLQMPLADMEVLDVAPQEYKIDNNLQADPVGVIGNSITGDFLNIVARASLKKNLMRSFAQAKVSIADDPVIAPIALAQAVLSENEMNSGCALVDFGADTTTVLIYKSGILRHLCILPMGGNTITRDICSQQLEWADAERLKVKYGDALYEAIDDTDAPTPMATLPNGTAIKMETLNDIVGARAEEILANVWNQLKTSGYSNELYAGVVFTGGGSSLKNLDEAFRKQGKLKSLKTVQFVQTPVHGYADSLQKDGTQCTLIGLLMCGKENCCMDEADRPAPEAKPQPATESIEETVPPIVEEEKVPEEEKAPEEPKVVEEPHRPETPAKPETPQKPAKNKDAEKKKKPSRWRTLFENITEEFLGDDEK